MAKLLNFIFDKINDDFEDRDLLESIERARFIVLDCKSCCPTGGRMECQARYEFWA